METMLWYSMQALPDARCWKMGQKFEDHEMNFNKLTQPMAAASREFFPNINYILKTLIAVPISWRRNEIGWRPGQEASLVPPCSYLRSFGNKCTVLNNVLVTLLGLFGNPAVIRRPPHWFDAPIVTRCPGIVPPVPPIVTPLQLAHAAVNALSLL